MIEAKIIFRNGIIHELTFKEIEILSFSLEKSYEMLFFEDEEIMDVTSVINSEEYKEFSDEAKAIVNLYSLFCDHLDF